MSAFHLQYLVSVSSPDGSGERSFSKSFPNYSTALAAYFDQITQTQKLLPDEPITVIEEGYTVIGALEHRIVAQSV